MYTLANAMEDNNLAHTTYLISSCTLHNLKNDLRNTVINVLGERGTEDGDHKMNVMQMLHGCFNLQNWHEVDELNEV